MTRNKKTHKIAVLSSDLGDSAATSLKTTISLAQKMNASIDFFLCKKAD